jgi:hypothetical protein
MRRARAKRSVHTMLNHSFRTVAVAAALALVPAASASASAAGKTETLRFFSHVEMVTLTHADGTVVTDPSTQPVAGDRLDVYASDFAGNHKRHAKQSTASEHVQCVFTEASPEPDCVSHVAIGGSLLIFQGDPAKLIGGAGRYLGATGRVISNKTIGESNDSDIVARITLR